MKFSIDKVDGRQFHYVMLPPNTVEELITQVKVA